MGLAHSPRIVTDELVLALDAGNPKNYNAGISTNWTDKVGGNNGTLNGGTYHTDGPFVDAGYVEFDGTGDYLSLADSNDFDIGLNNEPFTWELWFYRNSPNSVQHMLGLGRGGGLAGWGGTGGHQYIGFQYTNGSLYWQFWSGSSLVSIQSSTTAVSMGSWHHYAVSYDGTTTRAFLDGVLFGSSTSNYGKPTTSNITRIGAGPEGTVFSQSFQSNIRVIKGTALYTSNFTPPTEPLKNVTNTTLLTCQGNTITDASSSAHTITTNGNISPAKEPYGGAGAFEFGGTNDYLSVNSSVFNPGTGDFTIEWWQKLAATDVSYSALKINSGDGIRTGNTAIQLFINGSINIAATATFTTTDWEHVAIVRSSGVISIYHKGVLLSNNLANLNPANSITASIFEIGNNWTGSNYAGSLSNFRVVVGTAVYTSNFTPPTTLLEPIENTTLLTLQGQNIKDASSSANSITINEDVKPIVVSSTFEFDGTDDYVILSNLDKAAYGTTNFSLSLWFNADSGSYKSLFQAASSFPSSPNPWIALVSYSSGLRVYVDANYRIDVPYTQVAWNNFVLTFDSAGSGLWTAYLNGSSVGSYTGPIGSNSASDTYLGHAYNNSYFDGKISNFSVQQKTLTAAEIQQNYNALKRRYE